MACIGSNNSSAKMFGPFLGMECVITICIKIKLYHKNIMTFF